MLWSDQRISQMTQVVSSTSDPLGFQKLFLQMREEYEERIAELEHANTRLIEVDLEERYERIAELEHQLAEQTELVRVLSNGESWALRKAASDMDELREKNADLETKVARIPTIEAELANRNAAFRIVAKNLMGYNRITAKKNARITELEREVEAQKIELFAVQSAAGNTISELEAQLSNCG